MGCGAETQQLVPTKYSYKYVPGVCGQTDIHGGELLCEDCQGPVGYKVYERMKTEGDEYVRYWLQIELEEELPLDRARKQIEGLLDKSCYCEHDCCGHWNGGGYVVEQIGKRTYKCRASYAPNY